MPGGQSDWIGGLTGDREIADLFSDHAQFKSFARFESALVSGLAKAGLIDPDAAPDLQRGILEFLPDEKRIATAAVTDGVPVPEYVRQLRQALSGPGSDLVHFGATSQDLTDTATVEALLRVIDVASARLDLLIADLDALEARDGKRPLKAVTRMQEALDIRASDRIRIWRDPLKAVSDRVPALRIETGKLQFGGAVGDLQALGGNAGTVAATIADKLGLDWPGSGWHTSRRPLMACAGWMNELSAALGKIGQDVAIMALCGSADIALSGGGSSSAMPHKQNPVTAERLVALSRFNASLMGAMHQAQIHEMERSGAAMTLEWMALPQICETTGSGLLAGRELIGSITRIGQET
ncbi:MAG: 3-carboxy-cis,cis-muconate cycloisomerase [Hoeflea sp.]|uniref:3-carboxy-cis,cis-muconate cycloisomerase n=1 Tax=Hoeflea sp. TaxID=1940281 RepID=UPI0032EC4CA2